MTYRTAYNGCPLCAGRSAVLRTDMCLARGELPRDLTWMKCTECGHVHALHFFTAAGNERLLASVREDGYFGGKLDDQRILWGRVIHRITPHVTQAGRWIDVGVGSGGFLFTAAEFGFDAVGIDLRPYVLEPLAKLGYRVEVANAAEYDYSGAAVVVLADILEHMPYPRALLERIRAKLSGAVFISCPNMDTVSWRYLDSVGKQPYWEEQEHYHNFTRARLETLLKECGFTPVEYMVSSRYQSGMEIIAV